ncbi:hypothetical protein [Mycoplasmoides pirum]|uniref:hypothetical protein n=1 Tax=Mycoplasmoides pirum TaxID=2122 RepID=UPI0012DE0294|nr:hypothetical protein [Mycoplasmoides pirum]
MIILLFFQLLPVIYKTTRIYFLGNLPDENAFNIASQILWLNVFYEIINESIVIPLFFVFSKLKENKNWKHVYSLITIFVFFVYLIFTISIFFNIDNILLSLIINNENLFLRSSEYIKYEVWGTFLFSIFSYLFLTTTIFKFDKYILINGIVCIAFTFFSFIFDLFFITDFSFSLKLSIKGIGINSIIVNFICCVIFVIYLSLPNIKIWNFNFKNNVNVNKEYVKQYFYLFLISSIEVLVRNLCFYFMIINPINSLNSSGIYWVANDFIWTWLLLPITTISIYIKETFILNDEENNNLFKYQLLFYSIFISIIIFIWLVTIPINPIFIKNVLGSSNEYKSVSQLILILIPFYIFFAYSSIFDSIFIRQGKISYYCIQSLIVNLTVYPIYFALWKTNIWTPTLESVAIMFGIGMLTHFVVDIPLFLLFLNNNKIIKFKFMNKH